jgi:dihydrofolate reductase
MITILVAYDDRRGIGLKGKIPWTISEDLKLFKSRTMGHPIIMGRNTWESLPKKPLPGRATIIVSSNFVIMPPGWNTAPGTSITVVDTIEGAVDIANRHKKEAFVVGGAKIYQSFLDADLVDRIVVSKIFGTHEADAFFPQLGVGWRETFVEAHKLFDVLEYKR